MSSRRDDMPSVAPKERVNIVYRPAVAGQPEEHELPLVMAVMGDFTGRPDTRYVEERKRIRVDQDNFTQVLAEQRLALMLSVPDRLRDTPGATLRLGLAFKHLDDFRPEGIAAQVPALQALVEARAGLCALRDALDRRPDLGPRLARILRDPQTRASFAAAVAAAAPPPPAPAAAPESVPVAADDPLPETEFAYLRCPRCDKQAEYTCPVDDYAHFKRGCTDDCPPLRWIPLVACDRCRWPKAPREAPAAPAPRPAPVAAPPTATVPRRLPRPDTLLRPARTDFEAFVRELDDLSTPVEALERAVARDWFSPAEVPCDRRGFARALQCSRCQARCPDALRPCARCGTNTLTLQASRLPTRVRMVAAFAADLAGIRRAEALAFEAVERFAHAQHILTGVRATQYPSAVIWCPEEPWVFGRDLLSSQFVIAAGFGRHSWPITLDDLFPAELNVWMRDKFLVRIADSYEGLARWSRDDIPNPFEPLADLWELGYAQVGLSANALYLLLPGT